MLVGVFPGAGCCPGGRGRSCGAWWLVLVVFVFGVVAGVSGCSGGGGAGAEGPVMSGDYYVQSDGSLRRPGGVGEFPVPDPLVGEYSDAGAEAMASYYFETVAYAWNVGDPRAFTDMVATGCQACANTANDITSVYGGAHKGGLRRWRVGRQSGGLGFPGLRSRARDRRAGARG